MSTGNTDDEQQAPLQSTDNPYFVERELRSHFEGIRIVSELDLSADGPILKKARHVVQKVAQHRAPDRLRSYPASTAAFLAAEGARCYDEGTFWPNIDIAPYLSDADQSKVGRAFLSALDQLGLENFSYAAARERWLPYVSPILMHGGIPAACADDVAELVYAGLREGIWDADDLIKRMQQFSARWSGLAKPVKRFFEYGDEFANDLLQRMIDTAADISELGQDAAEFIAELSADAGLPQYLTRALLRGERHLPQRGRRPPRPTVRIDRYSCDGPYMTLPPFPHEGEWLIQGAVTRRFATRRYDARDIQLAPSHGWIATLEWDEHSANGQSERRFAGLEQVHAYVFDVAGNLARQQHRLPAGEALILTSPGVTVTDSDGMSVPSPEELPPRAGSWSGWVLRCLDLDQLTAVLVAPPPGPGNDEQPTKLSVARDSARPKFVTPPVSDSRGALGGRVFGEPPRIAMPQDVDADRWRVRWRESAGEGDAGGDVVRRASRAPSTYRLADLPCTEGTFDSAAALPPAPAFAGSFEVSGPLGSDMREDITVVRGLVVGGPDHVCGPRELVRVHVTADTEPRLEDGTEIPATGLLFEAGNDTIPLTVDGTEFAVTIPRLAWAIHRTDGSFPTLGIERLRIGLDEIESGTVGSVLVRCGRPCTLRLELRSEMSLHEIGPVQANGADGRWSFSLAELRTTIAAATVPRLDLVLHVDDLREHIAVIEAQFEVSGLEVNTERDGDTGECLVSATWTENRQFAHRQLRLWSVHRPWEYPVHVRVKDEVAGRCEEILTLQPGPYIAEVTVADEWSSPTRPGPSQAGSCDLLVGSELQRRKRLESLRAEVPLDALELVIAGAARSRNLDVTAAASATDELTCALEAAAQSDEADANATSTLIDLVELVFSSNSLLPRLASMLVELPTPVLRRLELAFVAAARGSGGLTDTHLERLWKTLPTVAAALDGPFLDAHPSDLTEASLDRWEQFSGWRPEIGAVPIQHRIEPVTSPLDEFDPTRLRELQQALPPSGSLPLQWGGYLDAAFEMLTNTWLEPANSSGSRRSPDRERIRRWRSSHNAVYSYTQRFSGQQLNQLDLIKPQSHRPAWHKFPADVLAAAFHLVDRSSGRADTAEAAAALREAAEIAPLLTTRSILLALGLHHIENPVEGFWHG